MIQYKLLGTLFFFVDEIFLKIRYGSDDLDTGPIIPRCCSFIGLIAGPKIVMQDGCVVQIELKWISKTF